MKYLLLIHQVEAPTPRDPEAWATLNSDISRPFDKPKRGRIAVKVINHLGDEVMKVFRIDQNRGAGREVHTDFLDNQSAIQLGK